MTQAIDTTVRGVVYEARGPGDAADLLASGERVVRELAERNSIPVAFLTAQPLDVEDWLADARGAVASLLGA